MKKYFAAVLLLMACTSCYRDDLEGLNTMLAPSDESNDSPANSPYQKLVFADEFNGRDSEEDKSCFDIIPTCPDAACPADMNLAKLKNLNKCNWSVFSGVSFYTQKSAYHPNQVEVIKEGGIGFLQLSGKWQKDKKNYDCTYVQNPSPDHKQICEFEFGGIDSRYFSEIKKGRSFKFGRMEFRMRISNHENLYPALWTWPENMGKGYPYQVSNHWPDLVYNEIDVLEAKNVKAGKFDVFQTLHDWSCPPGIIDKQCNIWTSKKNFSLDRNKWYVFGAERMLINGKHKVRFYIDNFYTLTINEGDVAQAGTTELKKNFQMADNPFYLIISLGTAPMNPDFSKMDGMKMDVDWVRIYE